MRETDSGVAVSAFKLILLQKCKNQKVLHLFVRVQSVHQIIRSETLFVKLSFLLHTVYVINKTDKGVDGPCTHFISLHY